MVLARKVLDEKIHKLVGVEYKECSPTWKKVKGMLADDKGRQDSLGDLGS